MAKLTLLDIGCAGGIPKEWEVLDSSLINVIGVDANVAEIGRLKIRHPNYVWIAAQVGYAKDLKRLAAFTSYEVFGKASFTDSVISLDEVCSTPDFIKIDVDGHEIEILESGPQALAHASGVYLESEFEIPSYNPRNNLFNHGEVLKRHGFHLEYMWGQRCSVKYRNDSSKARCIGNGLWLKESHKLERFWKKIYNVPQTWLGEE